MRIPRLLMMSAAVVFCGGLMFAANNDWAPTAGEKWSDDANWSLGRTPNNMPDADTVRINGDVDCVVDIAAEARKLLVGYNGMQGTLVIEDGGSLTTGFDDQWVGPSGGPGTIIVEEGGIFTCHEHLWVGLGDDSDGSELIVNGGTVIVNTAFDLGRNSASASGNVYLNEGILEVEHVTIAANSSWYNHANSVMDIRFGTFIVNRNLVNWDQGINFIEELIADGQLTAFGGLGQIVYDYDVTNAGKTTITAVPSAHFPPVDFDFDDDVDIDDLIIFGGQWLASTCSSLYDINDDCIVNHLDFIQMASYWLYNTQSVDNTTLNGKVMCGYQGWFNCPGDGSMNRGWKHYRQEGDNAGFEPGKCTIDFWPDMSEMHPDEKFATPFEHSDGSTAYVFSSRHPKTIDRHFRWMKEYGIHGVFVQRFVSTVSSSSGRENRDTIQMHVKESAQKHGRLWSVMYDLGGFNSSRIDMLKDDFRHMVDDLNFIKDSTDTSYAHHKGKPVVAVWGIGFKDRPYTMADCANFIDFLKNDPVYGGNTVLVGVPSYWRTLERDSISDPELHEVIKMADIVHPWAVGRFGSVHESEMDNYANNVWVAGKIWCDNNGLDFMPVVFPGFSWHNLRNGTTPLDQIARQGGQFLWRQFYKVITEANASMIYVAMFDEMDEGTCIFKCTNDPPVGASPFLTYDQGGGEEPDHYLWLTGQATRMLSGQRTPTETMPGR